MRKRVGCQRGPREIHRLASRLTLLLALLLVLTACVPVLIESSASGCEARGLNYQPYRPLMAQVCKLAPIYVTGSRAVPAEAITNVAVMAQAMLQNDAVARRLRTNGAVIAVFAPPSENLCDLPYFSDLHGRLQFDGRVLCNEAGLAGGQGRAIATCSALNAVSAPSDRFRRGQWSGQNICVHEIAHLVMNHGLTTQQHQEVVKRFEEVKASRNLWRRSDGTPTWALTNAHEFFAEASQVYFWANTWVETLNTSGLNGPWELRDHDPKTFKLLERIYISPVDLR